MADHYQRAFCSTKAISIILNCILNENILCSSMFIVGGKINSSSTRQPRDSLKLHFLISPTQKRTFLSVQRLIEHEDWILLHFISTGNFSPFSSIKCFHYHKTVRLWTHKRKKKRGKRRKSIFVPLHTSSNDLFFPSFPFFLLCLCPKIRNRTMPCETTIRKLS